jgi:type II secretory pathway pseudopilin PulG
MIVARLRGEGGYSVFELLTVMIILGIVLTALTSLFVSATGAEADQTRRFQAQQEARLALDKMKREIHCSASAVPPTSSTLLVLNDPCVGGNVSWCTALRAGTAFYGLYRASGPTCDATGVRWAKYLRRGDIFAFSQQSTQNLASVGIAMAVNPKPAAGRPDYKLSDSIVLRNSQRACVAGTGSSIASPSPPC